MKKQFLILFLGFTASGLLSQANGQIATGVWTGSTTNTTTSSALGVGTTTPRGWGEVQYCPPAGVDQSGLIVTKKFCNSGTGFLDPSFPDVIGMGFDGVSIEQNEGDPTFIVPFTFMTGHSTNVSTPLYTSHEPLFWVRTEDPVSNPFYSGPNRLDTKMVVMEDGSVGINIARPRAALDVRGSQSRNRPAAIIGSRALGRGGYTGPNGLFQYYTQQVQFVPVLNTNGYNRISQRNDQGMFFSDGQGQDGANLNSAFVLAPWASSPEENNVGGMRMDKFGNTEFHGTLRTTQLKINTKWWGDFVFESDYKLLDLSEVEQFIQANGHLPAMPSETEILDDGVDVGEVQALQQVKIEELTLYVIEQDKKIKELQDQINKILSNTSEE